MKVVEWPILAEWPTRGHAAATVGSMALPANSVIRRMSFTDARTRSTIFVI